MSEHVQQRGRRPGAVRPLGQQAGLVLLAGRVVRKQRALRGAQ
jgi:hypothetical protein